MLILLINLHTFPQFKISTKNLLAHQEYFIKHIILLILVTNLPDNRLILSREITSWSLSAPNPILYPDPITRNIKPCKKCAFSLTKESASLDKLPLSIKRTLELIRLSLVSENFNLAFYYLPHWHRARTAIWSRCLSGINKCALLEILQLKRSAFNKGHLLGSASTVS